MARIRVPSSIEAAELSEFFNDGRLTCPHCGQAAKPHAMYGAEAMSGDPLAALTGGMPERYSRYKLGVVICASCEKETLYVRKWHLGNADGGGDREDVTEWHLRVYPIGRATKLFPNTPPHHLRSYQEACAILELSPAASACMSRRCLQGILKEQGYEQKDLVKQIDAALNEPDNKKSLSSKARDSIDAIRQFGNFGAHLVTDLTTLQLIEVEAGEAEWCIEGIEDLMDQYYEQPKKLAARREAANTKLGAGGKPKLKF